MTIILLQTAKIKNDNETCNIYAPYEYSRLYVSTSTIQDNDDIRPGILGSAVEYERGPRRFD